MPRAALLIVNRTKPDVLAALADIRAIIERHGRLVAELDADDSPVPHDLCTQTDLIIVLGGDGTLLGQSRRFVALGLPMLGVNFGKLGFLAEFDLAAFRAAAPRLLDDEPLVVQDRPMLRVTATPIGVDGADITEINGASPRSKNGSGISLAHTLALNDAVITAGPPYRMITLDVRIDGHPGPQVTGDGLVIATPIGSTAYNASLGGPIISPDVNAMALTPVAPQSLSFRPVIVPAGSTIEIELERVNDLPDVQGLAGGTSLVLDGQVATRLHQGQRVTIRQHARPIRFVRNPGSNYWSTLITKMKWATPTAPRV